MKYDPYSDEQLVKIEEENLLQPGVYDFEVLEAKDTISKAEYQRGHMDAEEMLGRTGKCKIVIQPAKGNFRAKSAVADYVKADGTTIISAAKSQAPLDMDDQIPF